MKKTIIIFGILVSAAIFVTIISCSNSTTSSTTDRYNATISGNHGHVIIILQADVDKGIDKIYDITGTADHMHNVTIPTADFTNLKAGNTIFETSTTTQLHNHLITISKL